MKLCLLLVLFAAMAIATAAVDLKIDLVGNGKMTSESDVVLGESLLAASGNISLGQSISTSQGQYSGFTGIDCDLGRFSVKTPEYSIDINNAKDLYASAKSEFSTKSETVDGETTTEATSAMMLDATGNGTIQEDIIVGAQAHKAWSLDYNGSFILNRSANFYGSDVRFKRNVL